MFSSLKRLLCLMFSAVGVFIRTEQLLKKQLEMTGFEPVASYMRSKRSTTELHPQLVSACYTLYKNVTYFSVALQHCYILNIVCQKYGTLFTAISINSIHMNSNKQFVITHACTCRATALRQRNASALWRVINSLQQLCRRLTTLD